MRIFRNKFKSFYLTIKKLFSFFLLHFWNLHQIFKHSEKKMTLLAYVFTKLQTARHVVRQMYKKHPFRTLLDNQHVKRSQTLVKSAWQYFYDFFRHSERKWFGKKPLLVICEILWHLVNTLSTDDKFLFVIVKFYRKQFEWIYLLSKWFFLNFFLHF